MNYKPRLNKNSLLAIKEMTRLGISPIEEMYEAMKFAKQKALAGGNVDENGKSDQALFVGTWLKAATDLAKFKHPTLSAVAIKEIESNETQEQRQQITAREAVEMLRQDPFFPKEHIPNEDIVDAMFRPIAGPLPIGEVNGEPPRTQENNDNDKDGNNPSNKPKPRRGPNKSV